ncbi:MAG TPA: aromatic ring-hydroxylating dioxygenase subunit alpha [Myxococcota bacterium]|nr:aromatic ring-hydroxylating dioxygenase subunit alpha [Myxococcota bacterium]
MARFARPPEGSWTAHHPELGTGLVSFEDSVSPAFFEQEREAIFKRAWLNVGRVEQLDRDGTFFTKDLPGVGTSILVTRAADGRIRALHNVCRHRGNKLVWDGTPRGEACGRARQLVCRYHGWRYGLDGVCTYVHQENEFFGLRKDALGLAPVHCDTWAGFIFVNLAREPEWSLRDYLGPMVGALEGYPFERMTERYSFRAENGSNWKIFVDAFQEYYHVAPLHTHQLGPTPEARNPEYPFEAAHYQIDGPHRMVSTSGTHKHTWPKEHLYPAEALTRSGNTGPWDAPDLGPLAGVNPSGTSRWGIDNFQVFPNLEMLIYERGWYVTYRYWPTSHHTHVFEGDLHFAPARTARERLAHEYAALTFKEYGLRDCGTLDGTQMGLEQRAFAEFPLCDQEILVRHFHKTVGDWVEAWRERAAEATR